MTNENPVNEDERQALVDLLEYYETTTNPGFLRPMAEFERFFGGWPMLEPGLVYARRGTRTSRRCSPARRPSRG